MAASAERKLSNTSVGNPRIGVPLEHDWRDRANQHGFGDAAGLGPRHVADNLAAADRVSDMHGAMQVKDDRSP